MAPAPLLSVALPLPEKATVADVVGCLVQATPDLAAPFSAALVIVNGTCVDRHQALSSGDQVVILAPMAGG